MTASALCLYRDTKKRLLQIGCQTLGLLLHNLRSRQKAMDEFMMDVSTFLDWFSCCNNSKILAATCCLSLPARAAASLSSLRVASRALDSAIY